MIAFIDGQRGAYGLGVGNTKVEPKSNAIIIAKQASGSAKIDPLWQHPTLTRMRRTPTRRASLAGLGIVDSAHLKAKVTS